MADYAMINPEFDIRKLGAELDATKQEILLAGAASINRAAMKARTQATRQIAGETSVVPQRLVRRRIKLFRANTRTLMASIWVLTRPVPAIQLAGVRDTGMTAKMSGFRSWGDRRVGRNLRNNVGKGVYASGGHHWPSAFVAMGSGHKIMVFEREGKARRPIAPIKISIHEATQEVLQKLEGPAGQWARDGFERDLKWRIAKRSA